MHDIVYITDGNYILPTTISIKSLINAAGDARLRIHVVLHGVGKGEIPAILGMGTEKIEIHPIEDALDFSGIAVSHPYVTKSALCKFYLPEILADREQVLYIDGDTLVNPGFLDIFNEDIANRYAAVVMDLGAMRLQKAHEPLGHDRYFNSGVMFLNLEKMRADGISEKLMQYRLKNKKGVFMDQDAFNAVFGNCVTYMDLKYNCLDLYRLKFDEGDVLSVFNATRDDFLHPAIEHFAGGEKPWLSHKSVCVDDFIRHVPSDYALPVAKSYIAKLEEGVGARLSILEGGTPKRPYGLGGNMLALNADGVTLEGFHSAEEGLRWTSGLAKINVSSEDFLNLSGDIRLHLRLCSFHEDRHVLVRFNGKTVFDGQVPCGHALTNIDVTLEHDIVQGYNTIEIVPDGTPLSPFELGFSLDDRKLALGIAFVKIVENTVRRFSSLENGASLLDARSAALEGRSAALEGRSTALEGRSAALEGRSAELEGRAAALEGRAAAHEAKTAEIDALATELEAKTNWLDKSMIRDQAALDARFAELDVAMAELRNDLAAIRNSTSYRVGRAVTAIPRKIRRWLS